MKIEVNITDFWLEEEGESLEEALKSAIKSDVLAQIKQSIKEKVDVQLVQVLKEEVEKELAFQLRGFVSNAIATDQIPSRQDRTKMVTLQEYIRECFAVSRNFEDIERQIKKIGETFATDLKSRYDLFFASQVVAKLNESGLLKEDIATLLLNPVK